MTAVLKHELRAYFHAPHPIFAAILRCLPIVPALEFQHIQHLVHMGNFRLQCFPLLFKECLSLGVGGCTFHAPVHKLLNILDFQSGLFQTLNNPQCFKFGITKFADARYSLHLRKKSLFIVIAQGRNGQTEHF